MNNASIIECNSTTESEVIKFGVDFLQSLLDSPAEPTSITVSGGTPDFLHCSNFHQQNSQSSVSLTRSREYCDLIHALQRLKVLQCQQQVHVDQPLSFLQCDATDEILLRILSYLQCHTLVNTMSTCTRWYRLTRQYATYRTTKQLRRQEQNSTTILHRRQLSSPLQLLQAYENVIGVPPETHPTSCNPTMTTPYQENYNYHVPIPILLPGHRPIRVTDCGDVEYNGIYYCTGCNGNGYIFTKPRNLYAHRHSVKRIMSHSMNRNVAFNYIDTADSDDIEIVGQPLRCIIARRFSNEDLLWYMNKEVFPYENMSNTTGSDGTTATTDNTHMTVTSGTVQQIFSFWAPLTQYTESIQSPFLLHYPNFTTSTGASVPSPTRRPTAWHSLSTTNRDFMDQPPIVQLVE